jgi:alpha-methylacyl-CoA racemase
MFLIAGVLAALVARARTGKGQVVDAAMIDGASMLAAPFFAFMAAGIWQDRRGANLLDSGCPFYDTYETADDKHVAVACLEPQFFAEFARLLPLEEGLAKAQYETARWDEMRAAIAARLKSEPRDHWTAMFEDSDACVAPVLSLAEAPTHPHNRARATHVKTGGLTRPGPAPRFAATPSVACGPAVKRPASAILGDFGIEAARAAPLVDAGILGA